MRRWDLTIGADEREDFEVGMEGLDLDVFMPEETGENDGV